VNALSAITLFVENAQRSKAFYADVFGVPLVYEDDVSAVFRFDSLLVNLLAIRAAGELIEPAPVGGRNAGSRFQLTITVDDADAACAELTAKGVELLNGPMNREWGVRTAAFADPDGHVWELAQQLS
jgi:lactoylglutathione lyase